MPATRRDPLYAAAFHGAGPPPLPPAGDERSRWLAGVWLGGLGRYGPAAEVLLPGGRPAGSLAASARASHLRQLCRHAEAEVLDRLALRRAPRPTGPDGRAARADALIGLVADAVGAGRLPLARRRLARAAREIAGEPGPAGWRELVRLDWVRAEVALLGDDPAAAVGAARAAVARSRAAGAPRHVAKSLLFLGAATSVRSGARAAVPLLRQAADAATAGGLLPLVWPTRLLLAELLDPTDPDIAVAERRAAASAICAIRRGLPAAETATLLARPEIRPLVGLYDCFRTGSSPKVTRTDYSRYGAVSFTGVTDGD
jgi:hypothetical protein